MHTPKKILVVDDDIAIVDMISDILIEKKHQVLGAFNGKVAYEIAQTETPDLIIMDWEMPVQNGIETTRLLKENESTRDIPVIIITGRMTSTSDLETAFEAGSIDFIRKPIEAAEILARSRSMLLLAEYHKESIRRKDWELTNLTKTNQNSIVAVSELIHLVEEIMQSCKTIDHFTQKELTQNIQKVKLNLRNNTWEHFQEYFNKVHPDFSSNLLKSYQTISPEELKLAYFLRLNMSSKEIANITNKEIHSIDIARYRLRKKLGLERNEKLQEFLMKF
ncbi:MAG: response regulator [Prolixibacteraceae bacterium]|nr:response regulator [Prolixibacteraceae bacterium]MBN2648445.1 response regulator [Prolixibacteraceae bacterium]